MSDFITAIDFGSSKVAVAVGKETSEGVKVVSFHSSPIPNGIKNGEIINEGRVIEALRTALKAASSDIGEDINKAVINISGRFLSCKEIESTIIRNDSSKYVTAEELEKYRRERYKFVVDEGNIIYEVIPQKYDIDDLIGYQQHEIIGTTGRTLKAYYKIFHGKATWLTRCRKVLSACGVEISKIVLSPIASARAVLTEAEMENGVVLADIGRGLTQIAVVKKGIVIDVRMIPFAGESITVDIQTETSISPKWAEMIKLKHGCCVGEFTPEDKKLILRGNDGIIEDEVSLAKLTNIIEARTSEILEAIKYVKEENELQGKLSAGVVITGGTCYLEGFLDLAKVFLGKRTRLAAPRGCITPDSEEKAQDTFSSTVVGLLLEGFSNKLSFTEYDRINASETEVNMETETEEVKGKKESGRKKEGNRTQKRGLGDLFGGIFGETNDNC
ncbi:MAG: cell division protein FtsA [Bacteroidales bacterium]|nr:cell division protein FtsA [Bacteroidales bacterium]